MPAALSAAFGALCLAGGFAHPLTWFLLAAYALLWLVPDPKD